jgi:hypothetical protein
LDLVFFAGKSDSVMQAWSDYVMKEVQLRDQQFRAERSSLEVRVRDAEARASAAVVDSKTGFISSDALFVIFISV